MTKSKYRLDGLTSKGANALKYAAINYLNFDEEYVEKETCAGWLKLMIWTTLIMFALWFWIVITALGLQMLTGCN